MASPQGSVEDTRRIEKCTKYFDALWFCYSPVYQMKQYYVYGTVDDCKGHWSKWFNCLKQKTKFKDEDAGLKPPEKHPLWQLRSKEEAQAFWQEEFGHLSSDDGEDEEKPSRWTTYFSAPASE